MLTIDVGSSGTRVSAISLTGDLLDRAHGSASDRVTEDRAEVAPDRLWDGTCALIRQIISTTGQPLAIGIAAQISTLLLDHDLAAAGPALAWQDRRAAAEARELEATLGEQALAIAGRSVAPELTAPRLRWIAAHEPGRWARARWVSNLKDHLIARLTGEIVTDATSASYTLLFDVSRRSWSPALAAAAGVDERRLPRVLPADAQAGVVTRAASDATGLAAGIPVAVGGPDGSVGALGSGAATAGPVVDIAGTTDVLLHAIDVPIADLRRRSVLNAYLLPGLWTVGGPTGMTGGAIAWLAALLGFASVAAAYDELAAEAEALAPGAGGVTFHTALTGERFPRWEGAEGGRIAGLRPDHGRAQLLRAAEEGSAFALREGLEVLADLGVSRWRGTRLRRVQCKERSDAIESRCVGGARGSGGRSRGNDVGGGDPRRLVCRTPCRRRRRDQRDGDARPDRRAAVRDDRGIRCRICGLAGRTRAARGAGMSATTDNGSRPTGPLDDVRVLDLTRFLSGPYATSVLADLGADVVKVLRPGESVASDGLLTRAEAFHWATNRGKRSIELDLRSAQGREQFLSLVACADVVFDNFRPGTLDRLGLGDERLREANPRIITCDITGWGLEGPWANVASYDLIAQAASGSIDVTGPHGDPDTPPCRWGVPIGDIAASLFATIGLLAALAVRDRDSVGVGQRVSVSMLDCLLALSTYRVPQTFDAGLTVRMDPHKGGAGTTPYGPYRCSDGRWIAIGFAQPHWTNACKAMEAPELLSDPRFESELSRNRYADELDSAMSEILARRTANEWEALFIKVGAPAGKVNTLEEAFAHPQIQAREMIVSIADDAGRSAQVAADPMGIQSSTRPPRAIGDPADLHWYPRPAAPAASAADGRPPLDGTRVIEMDGNEPSKTLAMQILADLGADVLLIERPVPVRPRDPDANPDAFMLTDAFSWGMHRGKRGAVLNLKDEAGKDEFWRLLSESDIVYDNYRPGVKARLGVSREELTARRPGLVTCSATGFGATGPWAQAPAYDVTLQALSGAMSITGNGGADDPPIRWGHPIGGLAGGLYGAIAVLASLRDVRRGRPSRHTDLSLLDIQIALHTYRVPQALTLGMEFGPEPRAGGSGARPYGVYPTKDGRWLAAGITDQFWEPFCQASGHPEVADDPRFRTGADRTANADELEREVEQIFRSKTAAEWDHVFLEHGLPGSSALTLEEAFHHPQATADGMLHEIQTSRGTVVHVSGFPIRFSHSPAGKWTPPPGW